MSSLRTVTRPSLFLRSGFHQAMSHVNGLVEELSTDALVMDGESVGTGTRSAEELMRALEDVRRALANLRVAGSPLQIMQRAATELVTSCGFERVLITRMT